MTFRHTLRVRYHECDPMGIVFNANYVMYVDLVVTELWREALGGYKETASAHGLDLAVGEVQQRYLVPATYDDELVIALAISDIGTTSITSTTTFTRGDEVLVEGWIRHVCVDRTTMRKTPVPGEVRAALLAAAG